MGLGEGDGLGVKPVVMGRVAGHDEDGPTLPGCFEVGLDGGALRFGESEWPAKLERVDFRCVDAVGDLERLPWVRDRGGGH